MDRTGDSCPSGQTYNSTSGECESSCPTGYQRVGTGDVCQKECFNPHGFVSYPANCGRKPDSKGINFGTGAGSGGGTGGSNPAGPAVPGAPTPAIADRGGHHSCPSSSNVADPINVATGNLFETEVDYAGAVGSFPLRVERTYNSQSGLLGLFGNGWSSNLDTLANLSSDGNTVFIKLPDGLQIPFVMSSGSWTSGSSYAGTLTSNAAGYTFTTVDRRQFQFDSMGKLIAQTDAVGAQQTYAYTSGQLTTVTDQYGNTLTMTYNSLGLVASIAVGGQTFKYRYNESSTDPGLNNLVYAQVSTGEGATGHEYSYHSASFPWALTSRTDETGTITSWSYDGNGFAIHNDRNGTESINVDYTHIGDATDPYSLVTNAKNYSWKYHMQPGSDGVVRVIRIEGLGSANCAAASNYTSYDSAGHAITVTDGNGNVTLRHYTANGLVDQETRGYHWSGTATGNISDLMETTAMYKRVVSQWDATGTWPMVEIESGKNAQGQWTNYRETDRTYDNHGRVMTQVIKDLTTGPVNPTRSWSHAYTYYDGANTQLATDTMTGPLGSADKTIYQYDMQGHLQQVTNALSQSMTYSQFNAAGLPTLVTDSNGVLSALGYDVRNRLQKITRNYNAANMAQGQTTQIAYYANGLLKQVTQPDGSWVSYVYKDGVHVSRINDNANDYMVLTPSILDGQWTQRDINDPGGVLRATHKRVFDDIGRLLQDLDNGGQSQNYAYDNASNLHWSINALGNGDTQSFDALNRLITRTDDLLHTTNTTYDGLSQVTSIQDPNGNTTSYTYDGFGNLKSISSPDSGTTTFPFYDGAGNALRKIDGRGVETDFSYDVLSRLKTVTYPGATSENVTNTYDDTSNGNKGVGHLTGYSNDGGSTALTYDVYGNIIKRVETLAGQNYTSQFQFDNANRVTQTTYPDGHIETLGRNNLGQISQVQTQATSGATAQTVASAITYFPFGASTGATLGNGVAITQSYDLDRRAQSSAASGLTDPPPSTGGNSNDSDIPLLPPWGLALLGGLLGRAIFKRQQREHTRSLPIVFALTLGAALLSHEPILRADTLTYDQAGNVKTKQNDLGTSTYQYDVLNRLKQEQGPAGTINYSLDANSNRLSDSQGTYTYPATSNKLSTRLGATVNTDGAGNITADGTGQTFTYNQAGKLKQVFKNGTLAATYTYNALGQRTTKVTPAGTTVYHYDLQGHLIQETTAAAVAQTTYVWRDDTPTAIIFAPNTASNAGSQEKIVYVQADPLNTPRRLTDASAKTVWRLDGDAFGATAPNQDPNNTGTKTIFNLRFPGQYYDAETGLTYNNDRYYISLLDRYLTSDRIGLKGGLNTYVYANANPLSFTDPLGLDWVYHQGSGQIQHVDPNGNTTDVGTGYAGQNAGYNNPANQGVPGVDANSNGGPLPQGTYDIGAGHNSPSTGPNTMNLTPQDGTDTLGRDLFRIHGDNAAHNNTASHGCIVAGPNIRNQINSSPDRVLRVVP